jgi:hypothetical protein
MSTDTPPYKIHPVNRSTCTIDVNITHRQTNSSALLSELKPRAKRREEICDLNERVPFWRMFGCGLIVSFSGSAGLICFKFCNR